MANELGFEKSPYLMQHASNPVHWKAWSPQTLAHARELERPLFVSIGYATCHWCHVMEHESFENRQIADYLNEHFTCIKIDREEHPDIDSIYMNALQMMNGRGGWPLNIFLDTALKPFFGGTYFRAPVFLNLLGKIHEAWTNDKAALLDQGEHLYQHLVKMQNESKAGAPTELPLKKFLATFESSYDAKHGGKSGAPKFPVSYDLILLSNISSASAPQMIANTIAKMSRSGTYDHLEGGLHRYSTDAEWKVPHFEKMLYDQAGFVEACLADYRLSKNEDALFTAKHTVDYVIHRLQTPIGGFYSAEDADSEGIEGKFYRWDSAEIETLLGKTEFSKFTSTLDWPIGGNFENHHVLHITHAPSLTQWHSDHHLNIQKLKTHREQRIRPITDTKVLTSWNGLFLSALSHFIQISGTSDEKYLQALNQAIDFAKTHLFNPSTHELFRRSASGESKYRGSLADYTFLTCGLIDAFALLPSQELADWIESLFDKQEELFSDSQSGLYWTTPHDEPNILIRELDTYDNVEPSPNSIAFKNLSMWYALTGKEDYWHRMQKMVLGMPQSLQDRPHGFPVLLSAMQSEREGIAIYFVVSNHSKEQKLLAKKLYGQDAKPKLIIQIDPQNEALKSISWLKNKIIPSDKTMIYLCQNQSCQMVSDIT